ncbi:MAG: YqaA family protein [Bacteroidales bacterium]|jgi:membrane protein YqaA with SNARE-associated domain|nr:YqaA family protein [Bacteroidales bacterium]
MFQDLGYLGLFLSGFLGSTVLPLSSDIVLIAFLALGYDAWISVIIATIGNFLGGMTSYYLGYLGKWEWLEKYFKTPRAKVEKFQLRIQKWGSFAGLLAWLPIIGDVIAIALGFMKINPWLSSVNMLIGRFLRYLAIAGLFSL